MGDITYNHIVLFTITPFSGHTYKCFTQDVYGTLYYTGGYLFTYDDSSLWVLFSSLLLVYHGRNQSFEY